MSLSLRKAALFSSALAALWVGILGFAINTMLVEVPLLESRSNRGFILNEEPAVVSPAKLPSYVSVSKSTDNEKNYNWGRVDKNSDVYAEYSHIIKSELNKYDVGYLKDRGLTRIYLVNDITTSTGSPVLGYARPLSGEIYLNVTSGNKNILASVVHHELAHVMLYSRLGSSMINNGNWKKLGGNPEYARNALTIQRSFPEEGFVSTYAKTSPEEDMAEVYAYMMTDSYKKELSEKIKSDNKLKNKVNWVRNTLK